MRRRGLLGLAAMPWVLARNARAQVIAERALAFPADFGAHPDARIEWWYITGALEAGAPRSAETFGFGSAETFGFGSTETFGFGSTETFGFQVTFFRSRTDVSSTHPSRFAATQLVFAHAAITDLQARRLRHDQRVARAGFGIAQAAAGDTELALRGWRLVRSGPAASSTYRTQVAGDGAGIAFDLTLETTQPVLLQGVGGYSRKGPLATQASHYYSQPQLLVSGSLSLDGRSHEVSGRAWLDHEWSQALLAPDAVGWDWIGINLDGGGALTAFRIRRADGSGLWAGGSFRAPMQPARNFAPDEVRFTPLRLWQSPASAATYPVHWRIDTAAGSYEVRALLDAQELDSRASTGSIYWEGLSELLDTAGRRVGIGYLEMTGYAARLRLQ